MGAGTTAAAAEVLASAVKNILAAPAEPKFRTLKKNKAQQFRALSLAFRSLGSGGGMPI